MPLSKSRMLSYRQCHRKLWLEIHHPELKEKSPDAQLRFAVEHQVREIARRLYDPQGTGLLVDNQVLGVVPAIKKTQELLSEGKPIFEAGFSAGGVLAFIDVLLPVSSPTSAKWGMIEVKSSTSIPEYYRDDVAVQAYVMKSANVDVVSIALAHIDNTFVYDPDKGYSGLLIQEELAHEAVGRFDEVKEWVGEAHSIAEQVTAPSIRMGSQCKYPYGCGFYAHCSMGEPKAAYPASLLPRIVSKKLKALVGSDPLLELSAVPDELLNDQQKRVKLHTLADTVFFDRQGAAQALSAYSLPAYFMDFETVQIAIPVWKGMRPYQQVPFQFSVHYLSERMELSHTGYLDLLNHDPSESFAIALIDALEEQGTIFVYNAAFEKTRIAELEARFPQLAERLSAIRGRIVDLLPIARDYYYHPSQQGSWSIKAVLPTIAPDLGYDALQGVQNGGDAMAAYTEAILPETTGERQRDIEMQLHEYCKLDTLAMVRMWETFTGRATSEL